MGKIVFDDNFASRFWNAKLERVLARDTSSGCVTVMAGVQAVAALAGDEHGHYEDDDYSSALSDEHFRLEKEYESQIERDVNAPRGTQNGSERAPRADPMSPGFAHDGCHLRYV